MAQFSSHVMEGMGLRRIEPGETIVGRFFSIHVFEVQGFIVDAGTVHTQEAQMEEVRYRFGIGASVNSLCQALLGDDFVPDEADWAKEHSCTPPYVIVLVGPTSEHACAAEYVKVDGSEISTYEGFRPARQELHSIEAKVLPAVASALSYVFNAADRPVRFRFVTKAVSGRTSEGKTIHDFRIDVRASGYASRPLSAEDLVRSSQLSAALARRINPKVSRFFHLALEEGDSLKKFLYFFLAIEIETHAAFASIDHDAELRERVRTEGRLARSSNDFLKRQRERWTTLMDRFMWCALTVWTNLDDVDIDDFKMLKRLRDEIAHGSISSPPESSVSLAQRLAQKLQQRYA